MYFILLGSPLVGQAELHAEPGGTLSLLVLPLVGLAVLLLVALVVWCCIKPLVARVFARIFSVAALGFGAGVLTWGICAAAMGGSLRSPFGSFITEPSEAIGCGAGFLVGGITALVLSFVGGRKDRSPGD